MTNYFKTLPETYIQKSGLLRRWNFVLHSWRCTVCNIKMNNFAYMYRTVWHRAQDILRQVINPIYIKFLPGTQNSYSHQNLSSNVLLAPVLSSSSVGPLMIRHKILSHHPCIGITLIRKYLQAVMTLTLPQKQKFTNVNILRVTHPYKILQKRLWYLWRNEVDRFN